MRRRVHVHDVDRYSGSRGRIRHCFEHALRRSVHHVVLSEVDDRAALVQSLLRLHDGQQGCKIEPCLLLLHVRGVSCRAWRRHCARARCAISTCRPVESIPLWASIINSPAASAACLRGASALSFTMLTSCEWVEVSIMVSLSVSIRTAFGFGALGGNPWTSRKRPFRFRPQKESPLDRESGKDPLSGSACTLCDRSVEVVEEPQRDELIQRLPSPRR